METNNELPPMFFKRPSENAPPFMKGKVLIRTADMLDYLKKHDSDGWVNFDLLLARETNKPYFKLNEWKPPAGSASWTEDRVGTTDRTPKPDTTYRSSIESTMEYPVNDADLPAF